MARLAFVMNLCQRKGSRGTTSSPPFSCICLSAKTTAFLAFTPSSSASSQGGLDYVVLLLQYHIPKGNHAEHLQGESDGYWASCFRAAHHPWKLFLVCAQDRLLHPHGAEFMSGRQELVLLSQAPPEENVSSSFLGASACY